MADIMLPTGGGLIRYNDEYNSKFKFGPEVVIGAAIATVILVAGLHLFLG